MPRIQLNIYLTPEGNVEIQGPLGDKILCLGLLEMGKKLVLEHKIEAPKIVVPQMAVVKNG